MNAIGKITHTVNMEISYDLRSAALTIAQAFLKKWPEIVIKILRYVPWLQRQVPFPTKSQPADFQRPNDDVRLETG